MTDPKTMALAALDAAYDEQIRKLFGVLALCPLDDDQGSQKATENFSRGMNRITTNYVAARHIISNTGDGNA